MCIEHRVNAADGLRLAGYDGPQAAIDVYLTQGGGCQGLVLVTPTFGRSVLGLIQQGVI